MILKRTTGQKGEEADQEESRCCGDWSGQIANVFTARYASTLQTQARGAVNSHPGEPEGCPLSRLRFVMDEMSAEFVSRVNTLPLFLLCAMNMASLSPPIKSRSRASSTNLRPAITIRTLGRRRSSSCLPQERPCLLEPSSHESPLVLFLSKLIHAHGLSSPTSTGDFVLPSHSIKPSHRFPVCLARSIIIIIIVLFIFPLQIHAPILVVILLLPLSTALVLWSLSTLPISISWPRDIADLAQLGRELHGYSQSGPGPLSHVIAVMAVSAVWKHAWSVPGSVLWVCVSNFLFRFKRGLWSDSLECPWRRSILPNVRDHPPYHPHHPGFRVCYSPLNSSRTFPRKTISSGIRYDA